MLGVGRGGEGGVGIGIVSAGMGSSTNRFGNSGQGAGESLEWGRQKINGGRVLLQ